MSLFSVKKFLLFFSALVILCVPTQGRAFQVSPSVIDADFSGIVPIDELVSVKNDDELPHQYKASLKKVSFASDGTISSFPDISFDFGVSVSPESMVISSGDEGMYTVTFAHPERISANDVFALLIEEQDAEHQNISGSIATLFFPEAVAEPVSPMFRIDALSASLGEGEMNVETQFTNTGNVFVRPASLLVAKDMFGREIFQSVFAQNEGRLPVGTTRTVSDSIATSFFGPWHIGGEVTLTLVSVPVQGGPMEQASVRIETWPGVGVLSVALGLICAMGIFIFFFKKRGILKT